MKLRKLVLAAGMALAAVAAMAPMAQAEITHNTQSITSTKVLHYVGNFKFTAGVGVSLKCPVTAELHVSATGVPSMQNFAPDTTNCTGDGPLAGCTLAGHTFNSGTVHVNTPTPDLTATNFTIFWVYKPRTCAVPIGRTHLIFPELTLKPHDTHPGIAHHSMDTLTISGTAGSIEGTPAGPVASGLLHITEDEEGTYTLSTGE